MLAVHLAMRAVLLLVVAALCACETTTAPPGFRNGDCAPGPLTDSARNGEYVFHTSGVVDLQNEFVVVSRRGARAGDRLEASLHQLDGLGRIGLMGAIGEVRGVTSSEVVFRIPVYKPAGAGCWRVDVMNEIGTANFVVTASYVVEVRER
jgi:hypothetical protein